MKHVYDLLNTELWNLNREIARARNCGHVGKVARLTGCRRQVRRAMFYLEAHFGKQKGGQMTP